MPSQYPIRAAAKLTGLTVDTLRAWERRYHAVTPSRTARGRLYSDSDLRRLLLLRTVVEAGHAIGQVATLSDAELQELARGSTPPTRPRPPEAKPAIGPAELQSLLEALLSFDHQAVNDELGRLALLMRPVDLVHKVVLPLMHLAGEKWEHGTLRIAQEHMLSACMRNLLGGLVRLQNPGHGAVRLLLTTPSNELHEFGVLAAAMLANAHDVQAAYLGPNLPGPEILSAAGKYLPHVVVLGIMKTNATRPIRKEIHKLALELPAATELWVGGSGAADLIGGVVRSGTFIIEDLVDFERHLSRVKARQANA